MFGLIHLDDSPVTKQEMESMRSAMSAWGPDGGDMWINASAGLGSLILFNTPEALHEKLPLQSPQGFVLTAEARLDNRVELFPQLEISPQAGRSMPDGQVILHAYEKWGSDTPKHLLGDWSFAAWHPQRKELFLARDHSGNTGIYYYHDRRRFAFASSRQVLLSLGIPRRLNEFYLACLLVSWPAHHGPQTIELDIHRLPPSHSLTLQDDGFKTERYWRLENVPLLHLRNTQDYIDGFLSIFERAVHDRMRSYRSVGATLSGGLDSGSVTALAARALHTENKRLEAFTSVPLYAVNDTVDSDHFGDELPFAQAVASFAGNVDLIQISANDRTPIQAIQRGLDIHGEPGHAAGNMYWIYDLLASARQNGVGALLTGQGGNATISWTGQNKVREITTSLKKGNWRTLLQMLVFPLIPLSVLRGFYSTFRRGGLTWEGTAIHPDFAQRLDLASQYYHRMGAVSNPQVWQSPRQIRYSVIKPGASFLGNIWAENGAAHSMEVRDPTLDKRLMEFVLSIPDHEFSGPDGYDRWIIRAAMQGLLPDEVRLNRRRGRQAGDLGQRLVKSSDEVEQALAEMEASELAQKYLSLERMRSVWDALQQEVDLNTTLQATTILTRGIMAGLYLVDLEKAN